MTERLHHPRFLSTDEVLLLQNLALQEFGGMPGVRDVAMLDSALAQPRMGIANQWLHAYPFGMAAAYGFHLTQNHPFVDGNKRVAWAAMRAFLFREGIQLRATTEDAVNTMLSVAQGNLNKIQLAEWIEQRAVPRPRLELRDFFLELTPDQLIEKLVAIANSYRSGGPAELVAIVNEASTAIPAITQLAFLYEHRRADNEQAIHYIQLLCALYRLAEEQGYEW